MFEYLDLLNDATFIELLAHLFDHFEFHIRYDLLTLSVLSDQLIESIGVRNPSNQSCVET